MSELFHGYLKTMVRTERVPLPDLIRYQNGLTERLVRHARDNAPFYRDRLSCLFDANDAIDLSQWSTVPVLDRETASVRAAELRVDNLPPALGAIQELRTTGTSGTPLKFTTNGLARVAYNAALTRLARSFGADFAQPMAHIRVFRSTDSAGYPDGTSWKGWSMIEPNANSVALDLRTPARQQIEWLLRKGCHYLSTSPSNAMALAYAATPAEAEMLKLELIFSIGETILPGARELISEKLGARLIGIYSCEEVGYIATECPALPHYHVTAENTLCEVVDEHGLPVAPGQIGRVLVTGLYNYATPFIRYDVGDMAVLSDAPCPCGRTLPVISQVIGRTRNAFVFGDGRRAWPRVWDARAMRALVPCREFQVAQVDFDRIEFRYIPDDRHCAPDHVALNEYARKHFHPSVQVIAVPVDTIARAPGGKHEPFISFVADRPPSG